MARTITLPSGHTATLREITELRPADRRAVRDHLGSQTSFADDGSIRREGTVALYTNLPALIVARVVTAWTLPTPIPAQDPDWETHLDLDDYDVLEIEVEPYRERLLITRDGRAPEVRADGRPDTEGPTGRHAEPDSSSAEPPQSTSPQPEPSTTDGSTVHSSITPG